MEVILLKDVERLGKKGDVVTVRDGFGRNFLLPRALAFRVTRENQFLIEAEKKRETRRRERRKEEVEKLAQALGSLHLRFEVAVGGKDKLFGSVTAQDLAETLKQKGIVLDKRKIRLSEPIRSLGTHTVTVDLDQDVKPTVQVEIVRKKP